MKRIIIDVSRSKGKNQCNGICHRYELYCADICAQFSESASKRNLELYLVYEVLNKYKKAETAVII